MTTGSDDISVFILKDYAHILAKIFNDFCCNFSKLFKILLYDRTYVYMSKKVTMFFYILLNKS